MRGVNYQRNGQSIIQSNYDSFSINHQADLGTKTSYSNQKPTQNDIYLANQSLSLLKSKM